MSARRRLRRPLVTALVAAALLPGLPALVISQAGSLAAQQPDAGTLVFLFSPPEGKPALGDLTMEADVLSAEAEEVLFLVDGEERGRFAEPPYRLPLSFGDSVDSHRFEVIVRGGGRELARLVRVTPGLAVNEVIDLELQQLYVTVSGRDGGRPQLTAADFQVLDDGRRQRIVTFEGGDAPLTVALLIDSSASMSGGSLEAALDGARSFVTGMRELDEAAIYLFADTVRSRSPFSQRPDQLAASLGGVEASGGTALNDALYLSIRQLEARQGRRVVILLSDGVDVHSALDIDDVLWTLRRSRSVVYWIALAGETRGAGVISAWRNTAEHAAQRQGLTDLVAESGGRVVPIDSVAQAEGAFGDILTELRQQFVLGYYPTVSRGDGRWHRVRVKVAGRRLDVRTRGGYVDY